MSKRIFTNGLGHPVSKETIQEELFNYVLFSDAAKMIDVYWTVYNLHKQLRYERILLSKILILYSPDLEEQRPTSKGQTFYIHKDEIERFKREEYPKIKHRKRKEICPFCRENYYICLSNPCEERIDEKIKDERNYRLARAARYSKQSVGKGR